MLTEGLEPFSEELRPQRPRNRYSVDEGLLRRKLDEAAVGAGGKAALFDRHVLFQLSKIKDMYPIPRHLTRFMLNLAQVQPQHRFADLSCGSGGFLVHRDEVGEPGNTVGVELSHNWARIAAGNAMLHGMTPTLYRQSLPPL